MQFHRLVGLHAVGRDHAPPRLECRRRQVVQEPAPGSGDGRCRDDPRPIDDAGIVSPDEEPLDTLRDAAEGQELGDDDRARCHDSRTSSVAAVSGPAATVTATSWLPIRMPYSPSAPRTVRRPSASVRIGVGASHHSPFTRRSRAS